VDFDFKIVGDFISSVGIPGALLFMLGHGAMKLVPSVIAFLEGITTSLAKIETTLADLADDVRALGAAGLKPQPAV